MPQQRKQMTQTIFSTGFSLSFFSSCKPQVRWGSCHLPSPTHTGGSAAGQNPTVPGISPAEQEDGSRPNATAKSRAASSPTPSLSLQLSALPPFRQRYSQQRSSLTPSSQKSHGVSQIVASFQNKYSPRSHL